MEVHYELLNFIVQTGRGKNSRTTKMKVHKKVEIHTQTEKWLKRQAGEKTADRSSGFWLQILLMEFLFYVAALNGM